MAEKVVSPIQHWPYSSLSNVRCGHDRRQRIASNEAKTGYPLNKGRRAAIDVYIPCHRLYSRFPGVLKGDLTASLRVARAVCRTVGVEDGTRVNIYERRRFGCVYVAIRAVLVVSRCLFAVEECGIDGSMRARIALSRSRLKEAPLDRHGHLSNDWYSIEGAENAIRDKL